MIINAHSSSDACEKKRASLRVYQLHHCLHQCCAPGLGQLVAVAKAKSILGAFSDFPQKLAPQKKSYPP